MVEATWTQQTSGTTALLYGVSAVDANTAYACGAGGVIRKTVNGGTTWTTVTSGTATQLNAIVAVSATQVWVAGNGGLIRVSANGGTSWTTQTSDSTQNLSAITAASATTLWAAGAAGNIVGTTNAGATWTLQNNTGSALYAISAGSSTAAYASGAVGYMVATSNGGSTWDAEYPRTTQQLNATYFSTDTTGWAVGNAGVVMRTSDGANSWTVQQSGTANLLGVHFADANTGYAVGAAGRIIKTTNGGDSWVAQSSGTTSTLNGVWFTSPTTGVVVGAGGLIRRTTDGGATWTTVTSGTTQALYGVRFSGPRSAGLSATVGWSARPPTAASPGWHRPGHDTTARLRVVCRHPDGLRVGTRGNRSQDDQRRDGMGRTRKRHDPEHQLDLDGVGDHGLVCREHRPRIQDDGWRHLDSAGLRNHEQPTGRLGPKRHKRMDRRRGRRHPANNRWRELDLDRLWHTERPVLHQYGEHVDRVGGGRDWSAGAHHRRRRQLDRPVARHRQQPLRRQGADRRKP